GRVGCVRLRLPGTNGGPAMVVRVASVCGSDRRVGDSPTNAHIRPSRSRGQTWARARLPGTELRARLRRSLRTRGLRRAWEIFRQGPKPANRRVVQIRSKIETLERRGVAQPGSAPALGAGGRRFESGRPDHFSTVHSGDIGNTSFWRHGYSLGPKGSAIGSSLHVSSSK